MNEKFIWLLAEAEELAKLENWQLVYRHILGTQGLINSLSSEERLVFYNSETYRDLLCLIAQLRETGIKDQEPLRVITVRLPESLHESLKAEAHCCRTSLNQLCVSKLLQYADPELVPSDTSANHTTRRPKVESSTILAHPTLS